MSRTASSDRQTLAPSFPLLPLERLAYSIAAKRSLSREFFNGIGRLQPVNGKCDLTPAVRSHLVTTRKPLGKLNELLAEVLTLEQRDKTLRRIIDAFNDRFAI